MPQTRNSKDKDRGAKVIPSTEEKEQIPLYQEESTTESTTAATQSEEIVEIDVGTSKHVKKSLYKPGDLVSIGLRFNTRVIAVSAQVVYIADNIVWVLGRQKIKVNDKLLVPLIKTSVSSLKKPIEEQRHVQVVFLPAEMLPSLKQYL